MARKSIVCILGEDDFREDTLLKSASEVSRVQFIDSHGHLRFGLNSLIHAIAGLGHKPNENAFDLALLSTLVFCADTRVSREREAQDSWTREIDLFIPVHDLEAWNAQVALLEGMLGFLTGDIWRLVFRSRPPERIRLPHAANTDVPAMDCASLFSGGLDSFIGAIDLLTSQKKVIMVSHYMEPITAATQKACFAHLNAVFESKSFFAMPNYVCFTKEDVPSSSGDPNQRARSFLFFGLAVYCAYGTIDATLYVPENGLISLNVPLDGLRIGSLSTRTTHPYFMARYSELLTRLGINVTLVNPYRHKTKGEMAQECQNSALLLRGAPDTLSCSSPSKDRYKGLSPGNCGYCMPCIIRRAALAKAFTTDPTHYNHLSDLTQEVVSSSSSQGAHIRSFQYALAQIIENPHSSHSAIHSPGPLSDYRSEWGEYERVYTAGMLEIAELLQDVITRPQ